MDLSSIENPKPLAACVARALSIFLQRRVRLSRVSGSNLQQTKRGQRNQLKHTQKNS